MTDSILSLIGNTPLLKVRHLDTGPCELFLKLENQNPGGSIKDRVGLAMIEAAERDGTLAPGGVVVEATAGNTGLGLALAASQKGYALILVIPDKMSAEKIFHLKALGAEIVMTRSDVGKGHPDYYQDLAEKIARETPGALYVNQFANPANPEVHFTTTGPEIWEQMNHAIDAVVVGVGSSGTLTGLGTFFKKVSPSTHMVLADPEGSILAPLITTGKMIEPGSWLVEGIGEDFIPPNCDLSLVSAAYSISDKESILTARELLRKEGVLAGSSSGTLIAAALRYCRAQTLPKRVVTFVCDSGNKYLSKMYNDFWLEDHGFTERALHDDLRDLIARPFAAGKTVTVSPTDTLGFAYGRMKLYDVSQLPVMEEGKIVGLMDESDILLAVTGNEKAFLMPVSAAMTSQLSMVARTQPVEALLPVFDKGYVAIVVEDIHETAPIFYGLITRMDLLQYLRKRNG